MQKEIQQIPNLENLKINYRRFYFIVSLVISGVLIFLGWSLTYGAGEQNLGGWLIFVIIPAAAKIALIFIGLSIILKFIFIRIFKKDLKRPILISVLSTAFITVILGYFISPAFSIDKLFDLEFLLHWSGFILIGASAILVTILTKILRVPAPDFWRLNIGPTIITFSLVMIALPFIIGGVNYIFTESMVCNFVSGKTPQSNCYRIKAIKTGDINLCREKKLDQIIKGDCIISIAAYRKDPSFCDEPEVKNNSNSYNFCLSMISNNQ